MFSRDDKNFDAIFDKIQNFLERALERKMHSSLKRLRSCLSFSYCEFCTFRFEFFFVFSLSPLVLSLLLKPQSWALTLILNV